MATVGWGEEEFSTGSRASPASVRPGPPRQPVRSPRPTTPSFIVAFGGPRPQPSTIRAHSPSPTTLPTDTTRTRSEEGHSVLETEIRARATSDEGALGKRLLEFGYECMGTVTQIDYIFDLPGAPRFIGGEKLRLRHEAGKAEITFKSDLTGSLEVSRRQEATVQLAGEQLSECVDLMRFLGYQLIFTMPKRRTTYLRGSVQVTLDALPIIGLLVEVEGPEGEIDAAASEFEPDVEFRNYRLKELTDQALKVNGLTFEQAQKTAEDQWKLRFGNLALALGISGR